MRFTLESRLLRPSGSAEPRWPDLSHMQIDAHDAEQAVSSFADARQGTVTSFVNPRQTGEAIATILTPRGTYLLRASALDTVPATRTIGDTRAAI